MKSNQTTQPQIQSFLEKPIFMTLAINWELVFYLLIFVVAVATRFYALGDRVMSHDESLHALFSYKLYNGEGYQHDPLMHGPLQFHLVALSYLLFGDNDFSARVPAALFGVALVILPYWFRPWLGKIGALVTSVGLLISPLLLYYDRYIRNEAYIVFFTALMGLSLFQYMRTRQSRWLYIGALAVSLALSSKEVAYIHGFLGVLFIGSALLWEKLSPARLRQILPGLWALAAILLAAMWPLSAYVPPEGGFNWARVASILLMLTGVLIAALTVAPNADRQNRPVSATLAAIAPDLQQMAVVGGFLLAGLAVVLAVLVPLSLYISQWLDLPGWSQTAIIAAGGLLVAALAAYLLRMLFFQLKKSVMPWLTWPGATNVLLGPVVAAAVVFFLLHTTFFTNPAGFDSGTRGALTYWLKQQDVARGGQPGFYYLLLMPMYEFLPLLLGGLGGLVYLFKKAPSFGDADAESPAHPPATLYPSDGGSFAAYLILWALGGFVIYSWAGEKMPWLATHITLPFIFLLGHVTQAVFSNFNAATLKTRAGQLFTLLVPLLGAALLALITVKPFQGQSLQDLQATLRFVIALIAAAAILYGLWRLGRSLTARVVRPLLYLVALVILSVFTIRFAWLSSFVNYDYVNEFLVYAHGAPDVKWMLNQIDDISRRTVGDKQIKVAYGGVIWPLEWYMRDYPNRAFYGGNPTRDALDAPLVIVSPDSEVTLQEVEPYLGNNYQRFDYRQVWWPVENYKDQSLQKIWNDFFVPAPPITDDGPIQDPAVVQQAAWDVVHKNRQWLWDVLFYRRVNDQTFNAWPYRTQMYFFVRKDVVNQLWDYHTGPLGGAETVEADPYEAVRQDLSAAQVWGSNGSLDGQFVGPRALAVSPFGQVYVGDGGNNRVQVFDLNGKLLKSWPLPENPNPSQPIEIWGLAVGADGRVYVADTWNHRIEIFDEDGKFLSQFGTFADAQGDVNLAPGNFWGPRAILIDKQGNLYVADTGNKRVQKFTAEGEFLGVWGGGGITPGRFEEPVGLAADSQGNIYVADAWNRRVQKFDANFNFVAEWPVVAGWESQNVLNKPYIAVDSRDRVFISDPEKYRVIVYSNTGELLGVFGQYGQDVESFKLPLGLGFAADDSLFVLDSENNRVMKFIYP